MQQHPVPQNITGFQFKLIGSLTLKQFSFLAGAAVISFVIYIILAGIFAIVLITPIVLFALALAFVKIDGMDFEAWAIAFFNAITKPSQRVWRKEPKTFSFLQPEFSYYLKRPPSKEPTPSDRTKLDSFLAQVDTRQDADDILRNAENTKLSDLNFGAPKINPENLSPDMEPTTKKTDSSQRLESEPSANARPLKDVIEEQQTNG